MREEMLVARGLPKAGTKNVDRAIAVTGLRAPADKVPLKRTKLRNRLALQIGRRYGAVIHHVFFDSLI